MNRKEIFSCIEDVVTYLLYTNQHRSLKKAITEKQKHNVGFKPFNDFNCQMHTNAEKANSLINHVHFWIEMFKKDFVTLPLKLSPQIRYQSTIYIPWLWSSWLSDCKYVCVYVENKR
jgi:hypothetical protein